LPTVVVDSKGRVQLPAELRRRLGIRPGTELELSLEEDRIVLRPRRRLHARDLLGAAGREEVDLEEIETALGETL